MIIYFSIKHLFNLNIFNKIFTCNCINQNEIKKYYIITEQWSFDVDQWSILIGLSSATLTLTGFIFAYFLYQKQRKDAAAEAFVFFYSSLPKLKDDILDYIKNLEKFLQELENDKFTNPIMPNFNDKFINKLSILDLNRYFKTKRKEKLENFSQFLIDSNFFSEYHKYFSDEINNIRVIYEKNQEIFSNWQLLRSNSFFSIITNDSENENFKAFYSNWVLNLNKDNNVFEFKDDQLILKNRTKLVFDHLVSLAKGVFPFIEFSDRANEINLLTNKVIAAHNEIIELNIQIIKVFKKDINSFKSVLNNLNNLIDEKN